MIDLKNSLRVFVCCHLIFLKVCFSEAETRILNGKPSTIDKVPSLIQLYESEKFICGGTLISDLFVVTAAHCVYGAPAESFTVVGGASKRSDVGVRSKVKKITIPKEYSPKSVHADIAVLKLKKAIKGPAIKPASLCKKSFKRGDPVQVFGWGKIYEKSDFIPVQMQTIEINVVDKRTCQKYYFNPITYAMFCAAAPGKDTCDGDSGGPAIVNGEFCGVVSGGAKCEADNAPGIYTSIPAMLPFIEAAMLQ